MFLIFLLNLMIAEGDSMDLIVKHKQYSTYRINIYRIYLSPEPYIGGADFHMQYISAYSPWIHFNISHI